MEIHSKNPDRQMKIYNDMFPRSMINKTEVSGVINKFKKDIKNSKDSLSNVILENIRVEKNKMLETINKLRIPMLSNRTVKGILSDREHVGWEEVSKKIITSKRKTLAVELLGWQLNPNKSVKVKGEMIKKDAKIVQILCLAEYYAWIAAQKDSITQLNHPCKAFGDFMGFAYYGSVINDKGTKLSVAKNVHLVELAACDVAGAKVFNVGYGERYEDALQNGWLVAPTFDQDNHHQCWGSCNDLRTVALIKSYPKTPFNKTTLYDAIRKRHIYATDSKTLQLDFRVKAGNEVNTEDIAIMGDILDRPRSKITVYIKASNREHKINEILISGPQYRIIKPNRYFNSKALNDIKAKEEKGNKGFQLLMCEITVTKIDYIYLVVSMEDNRYAFSVPIWINYKKPTDQAILNQL